MPKYTLEQFVEKCGSQTAAAEELGICQAYLCQTMKKGRKITVTVSGGQVTAEELVAYPKAKGRGK